MAGFRISNSGHICAEVNKRIIISLFYYGQLDLSNIYRTVVLKHYRTGGSAVILNIIMLILMIFGPQDVASCLQRRHPHAGM